MFKFIKKGIMGMCMALVMSITTVVSAFADEVSVASNSIDVASSNLELVDVIEDTPQPRGLLSGYGSRDCTGSGEGSFVIDVNGTFAVFAGCTLKTSGFSTDSTIEISVCYGNDVKCSKILGPNSEVKNIAIWNVSPGGYTIKVKVNNNSNTGNITVWIY